MVTLVDAGLAVVGSSATSGDDTGRIIVFAAAVVLVLAILHRVAVPLIKGAVHILDTFVGVAIKLGVRLMALGAIAALIVIGVSVYQFMFI